MRNNMIQTVTTYGKPRTKKTATITNYFPPSTSRAEIIKRLGVRLDGFNYPIPRYVEFINSDKRKKSEKVRL